MTGDLLLELARGMVSGSLGRSAVSLMISTEVCPHVKAASQLPFLLRSNMPLWGSTTDLESTAILN